MGAVHRLQEEAVEQSSGIFDTVVADHGLAGALVDAGGEARRHGLEAGGHLGAAAALGGDLRELVGLDDGGELGVLVVGEVAGGLVERELADVRGEDLRVALEAELLGDEVLQLLAQDGAVRGPEDEALADVLVDVEELEVLAQLAVVAELGLLHALDVLGELVLGGEGGAVDALELFVFLVAAVVGARDGEEFEGLHLLGVAHMGAGAEVHELAVFVERDGLALGDVGEAAEFIALLAAGADDGLGLLAGDLFAAEGLVFVDDLLHLGLEAHEVVVGEFVLQIDVVVEAGLGGRTDVELGVGEDAQDRGGEDVGGGVTDFVEGGHHGRKGRRSGGTGLFGNH